MRRLLAVLGTVFALVGTPAAAQDADPQWQAVLEKARGQEVFWNAWGGGDVYNNYIAWVGDRVAEEYGITLRDRKSVV